MTIDPVLPTLPKNYLRPCLLLREQPAHGYELLERLQALGFEGSDPGGLYRSPRKLEAESLVRSAWERSSFGPRRRIYEITRDGIGELHRGATGLAEARGTLDTFLGRYEELAGLGRTEAPTPAQG